MAPRISSEQRREIFRLVAQGKSQDEIAAIVGRSQTSVSRIVVVFGGVIRKELWQPGGCHLTLEERIEIRVGLEKRHSVRDIARQLGRHASTVSR